VTDFGPSLLPARVGPVTIHTDTRGCAGAVDRPHPFRDQPKLVLSIDADNQSTWRPTAAPLLRPTCPALAGAECPRCRAIIGAFHWQATDALGTQLCISCLPHSLRLGLAELTDESRERLTAYVEENGNLDTSVYDVHHGGRQVGLASEVLRVDQEQWGEQLRDPLRRALVAVLKGPAHERQAIGALLQELLLADVDPKGRS